MARTLKKPLGPVMATDGAAVHVWFDGTSLRDKTGNVWAMTGTVAQVAGKPASAGPFGAVYYSLGTGADVLDFEGDFSLCIIYMPTAPISANIAFLLDGQHNAAGYYVNLNSTGSVGFVMSGAATYKLATSGAGGSTVVGKVNMACVGRSANTILSKVNGSAAGTNTLVSYVVGSSQAVRLGNTNADAVLAVEVWASPVAADDTAFAGLMAQAKAKLGDSAAW